MKTEHDEELPDCITLDPGFLGESQARELFSCFREQVQWRQEHAKLFGERIRLPRLTAWYADSGRSYLYSGIHNVPEPWTVELAELRDAVATAANARFNSVLLNLYRDGEDSVGWHSDDEAQLGRRPTIASVSLGETRKFRLRHKATKETRSIELSSGSLLVMRDLSQQEWQHCIPKSKKELGARINLTFRWIG